MAPSDLQNNLVRRKRLALGALVSVLACAAVAAALLMTGIVKLPGQQSSNDAEAETFSHPIETQASSPNSTDIVGVLDTSTNTLAIMTGATKNSSPTYSLINTWWNADPGAPFSTSRLPGWTLYRDQITRVVFEGSVIPTYTSYWFAYLDSLTTIERMATNLDTSEVVAMDGMFLNCSQLPDGVIASNGLDVSGFTMNKVRSAKAMFSGCTSLSLLDLSNWSSGTNSTEKIADWGSMFAQCSLLTDIQGLDKLDTSNATNMSYLFADCSLISTLNLYDWDTTQVTNSRCMFYRCAALSTLRLGANSKNLNTGAGVLDGCYIPAGTTVVAP